MLKVKIFVSPLHEEVIALKLRKDNLQNIQELVDVVLYELKRKRMYKTLGVELKLTFPHLNLLLVPLVQRNDDTLGLLCTDLALEYLRSKSKIYVEAAVKA